MRCPIKKKNDKPPVCSAVIVAAGSSQRMGTDKIMMKLGAMPVLARTILAFENSEYVACVCWCSYRPPRELLKKEWFNELIDMDYEGFKVKVPKRYHEVLTHIYGDYMQLPPEKERIAHHLYTAYRK